MELEESLMPEGSTRLHLAVNNQDTSILTDLLQDAAPEALEVIINQTDKHGRTPLGIALELGRSEAAGILVRNGARINVSASHSSSQQLSQVLESPVYQPLVQILIKERLKIPVTAFLLQRLMLSAADVGDEDLFLALLESYNPDVDYRDALGLSALHYACLAGHSSFVSSLLEHGATIALPDSAGRTPLHIACARGHLDIVCELLPGETGLSESSLVLSMQDTSGRTCGHLALYGKHFEVLAYLLNNFRGSMDLEVRDANGHTIPGLLFYYRLCLDVISRPFWLSLPCLSSEEATWTLHVSIHTGDMTLLEHVLASNMAVVDSFDFMDLTPLMWAARQGNVEACQVLLGGGADINLADHLGNTALHHACYGDQPRVADCILSNSSLKLDGFFDAFPCSLSTGLLEAFLNYFAAGYLVCKPRHWQKWLALAAENLEVTDTTFAMLVQEVCPSKWLDQLANGNYEHKPSPVPPMQWKRAYLPHYGTKWTKEESFVSITRSDSLEAYKELKSKIVRKPIRLKRSLLPLRRSRLSTSRKRSSVEVGRTNGYAVMEFRNVVNKHPVKKPPLNSIHPSKKDFKKTWYPLHEAARSGNVSVLDYIMGKAENEPGNLFETLLFEVKDMHGVSVVELMAVKHDKFAHYFSSSVVTKFGDMNGYSLPQSMSYEQALMHYLIVSSKPELFRNCEVKKERQTRNPMKSLTPLDKWSPAYRRLRFHLDIAKSALSGDSLEGVDDPHFLYMEEKDSLLATLLERYDVPDDSIYINAGYMPLLAIAVKLRCVWAVKVLLQFGATGLLSSSKLKGLWIPICSIIETGEVDLLELLGESIATDNDECLTSSQVEALSHGLLVLASRGLEIWTEKLYNASISRNGGDDLCLSSHLARLIYLSLSNRWTSFALQLVKDILRKICGIFMAGYCGGRNTSKLEQCFGMASHFKVLACFFSRLSQTKMKELLVSLQVFSSMSETRYNFFYYLCLKGKCDAVKLVLDVMDKPLQDSVFSKCCARSHSPLFYAAVNGYMDVVSLLIDYDCPLTAPRDGLLELRAAVLHTKLTKNTKFKSRRVTPKFVRCPVGNSMLNGGSYCPTMVEYFISMSDFKSIVMRADCLFLLSDIASLPSLDLAQPILQALERELQDTEGFCLTSNEEVSVEETLTQIIMGAPAQRRSSHESLYLFDSILCSLISYNLDTEVIITACDKGLWLLTEKFFPMTLCVDKAVLSILDCAIRDNKQGCLSLVCSELSANRWAIADLSGVLCSAVRKEEFHAVEMLLQFTDSSESLIPPLCLAVKNQTEIPSLILTKIISQGGCSMESFHKVLDCAARHNNFNVLESLLFTRDSLPISQEEYKQLPLWLTVLAKAARNGHEELSLEIAANLVAQFSPSEIMQHELYIDVLNWCCYWGMAGVLNHLLLSTEVLFNGLASTAVEKQEDCSELTPWCYAEAGGSVGKLADINSFDPSKVDAALFSNRNADFILLGIYSKLNSIKTGEHTTHSRNFNYFSHQDIFVREVCHGGETTVQIFLEDHLGFQNRSFFQFIYKIYKCDTLFDSLLCACCNIKNDSSTLNALLDSLANSGIDCSNNSSLKRQFIECVKLGEVDYIKSFVQYVPDLLDGLNRVYLLNTAVRSRKPEVVDLVLSIIGEPGPDCCLKDDIISHSTYPLLMAFSLGCSNVVHNSSLLATASKAKGFDFSEWDEASVCNGWFQFMMEENARMVSDSGDLNVESSTTYGIAPQHFSLHQIPLLAYKICLLEYSVNWGMESVLSAVLKSNGGVFLRVDKEPQVALTRAAHVLMDHKILNLMRTLHHCEGILEQFVKKTSDINLLGIAIKKLRQWRGDKEELNDLINSFCFICKDSDFCEKIFWNSCILGLGNVAMHFVNSDMFGERFASVLQRGLQEAMLHWHWSIAAEIMLKLGIPDVAAEEVGGNEVVQIIFSKETYSSILSKFFSSLINRSNRLPLAGAWLAYNWSRGEAELVVSRLGSMYAPPNPWFLERDNDRMAITIDWNSFSESLLSSPLAIEQDGGQFQYVPIVIEAIIFSPACLGQVVPSFCNHGQAFDDPIDAMFLTELQGFSSLIISCNTLPSSPSLSSLGGGQGLLTVVYEPNTRKFAFPEVKVVSSEQIENSIPEYSLKDVKNLSLLYKRKLEKLQNLSVSVSSGERLSDSLKSVERYSTLGELYYCLFLSVFRNIFDALQSIFNPKFIQRSVKLRKKVISAVDMQFDSNTIERFQPLFNVAVSDSVLSIVVHVPLAEEISSHANEIRMFSFYSGLVDNICEVILMEHVRIAQEETKSKIETFATEVLSSSLNTGCSVIVNLDDIYPSTQKYENEWEMEQGQSFVAFVKQVHRLKLFVRLFCKMMSSQQHDSKFHFRCVLDGTFTIVCTNGVGSPTFESHHGVLLMTVPIHTLQTKRSLYDTLLKTWQLFVLVVAKRDNLSSYMVDMMHSALSPLACYVDFERSPGLLFPVKGECKTFTIQMVDHKGHCLKSPPSPDNYVQVMIMNCESKLSEECKLHFSLAAEASGEYLTMHDGEDNGISVEWKPRKSGLYSVTVYINGIPIRESPLKCICVDSTSSFFQYDKTLRTFSRQRVYVVKHLSDCIPSSVQLKLFHKKPIRKSCPQVGREEFLASLLEKPTHFLSMYSAYGGSSSWYDITDATKRVTIHASTEPSTGLPIYFKTHSLNNGTYQVTMNLPSVTTSYSFFASCPYCQSVMKMYSISNSSIYPIEFSVR